MNHVTKSVLLPYGKYQQFLNKEPQNSSKDISTQTESDNKPSNELPHKDRNQTVKMLESPEREISFKDETPYQDVVTRNINKNKIKPPPGRRSRNNWLSKWVKL